MNKKIGWLVSTIIFLGGCTSPEAPPGMIYMPGGSVQIGSQNGLSNEWPVHQVNIDPFYLDKSPVTVAQFQEFVEATAYVTEAEQYGNSSVFSFDSAYFYLAEGADWRYPLGQNGQAALLNHPVTQVSWRDAQAYARWAGKRLPTEQEWEYAARYAQGGVTRYAWGNNLIEENKYQANTWQGKFPEYNTMQDSFLLTSPVGYFGSNICGLTDMGGNVWEWTTSVYQPYPGNTYSYRVDTLQKVIRGGSFMCDSTYCHGYRVSARQMLSAESAGFHVGFRCAQNID